MKDDSTNCMSILREDDRKILWNFFGAYFHEDWICEAETFAGIVAIYLCDASQEEVLHLRGAIL
jgi:CdiI immunity protein